MSIFLKRNLCVFFREHVLVLEEKMYLKMARQVYPSWSYNTSSDNAFGVWIVSLSGGATL